LHPNKQKYKSEKETLYFYYKNKNNNRKHIKKYNIKDKSLKRKLKHEPNIVEITHLCIRHGVHTRLTLIHKTYMNSCQSLINQSTQKGENTRNKM